MTATPLILLDTRLFVGGADLSGYSNKVEIMESSEAKKTTNFRSGGATEVVAGLASTEISAEGQWAAGSSDLPDDAFWAQRRTIEPWTAAAAGDSDLAAGNLMYLTSALRTKSQIWDQVGDVASWQASAVGTLSLARGQSAHPSGVPRIADGTGTALQLGAVSSSQFVYANLHVLSVAGTSTPTLTVSVQSDDNSGFTTPTTRGSFAAKTAVGGEPIRIAGPFTDNYWRVSWTITGSSPSFLFLAAIGIER